MNGLYCVVHEPVLQYVQQAKQYFYVKFGMAIKNMAANERGSATV